MQKRFPLQVKLMRQQHLAAGPRFFAAFNGTASAFWLFIDFSLFELRFLYNLILYMTRTRERGLQETVCTYRTSIWTNAAQELEWVVQ